MTIEYAVWLVDDKAKPFRRALLTFRIEQKSIWFRAQLIYSPDDSCVITGPGYISGTPFIYYYYYKLQMEMQITDARLPRNCRSAVCKRVHF